MSERELRIIADNIFASFLDSGVTGPFEEVRVYATEFKLIAEALAAEPDVVRVMRFIVDCVCLGMDKDAAWGMGYVKRWIEETFHVRLTDDGGWEWTE